MSGTTSHKRLSTGYLDTNTLLLKKGYDLNGYINYDGGCNNVYLSTKIHKLGEKPGSSRHQIRRDIKAAIKIIKTFNSQTRRELSIIKRIKHPNVVRLIETFSEVDQFFIVTEYGEHGDLLAFIKLRNRLNESLSRNLFKGIHSGIEYLHGINIIHRDLKCENIILNKHNTPMITDFGMAKEMKLDDISTTFCGSLAYTAPEILRGSPYTGAPIDIWSLGVVLYVMVYGTLPFRHDSMAVLAYDQINFDFPSDVMASNCVKNLIRCILKYEVEQRYDLNQIQVHSWFQNQENQG